MKNTVTRLALASLLAMGLGSAQAYTTTMGEDLNGNPEVALTLTPDSNSVSAASTFLDSFKGASVGIGTENFESPLTPVGATGPLTLSYPGTGGSLTATLTGGTGVVACVLCIENNGDPNAPTELDPATGLPLGRYSVPADASSSTNGKNYFNVVVPKNSGTSVSTADFTVTFNQNIAAFGFYGIDIGDHGGTLSVQLLRDDGSVINTLSVGNDISGDADGSVLFFSVTAGSASELFRSIRFLTTGSRDDDGFAFDNFTIADACQAGIACGSTGGGGDVPEPASLALVMGALLSLRLASRRRA